MSAAIDSSANGARSRQMVERELRAWRESIIVGCQSQEHGLYRPDRVMIYSCTLALIDAGVAEPDPFAGSRIEVTVSRFDSEEALRSCSSVDAHPRLFAEGRGLLRDWTSGRNALGGFAPEEWADRGIAVVWWRPHSDDQLCQYIEGQPGAPLEVGEERTGTYGERYLPISGPPVPNNFCEPPHRVRPLYPWIHAADRQLDLLGLVG
jgi:hypothetical protein